MLQTMVSIELLIFLNVFFILSNLFKKVEGSVFAEGSLLLPPHGNLTRRRWSVSRGAKDAAQTDAHAASPVRPWRWFVTHIDNIVASEALRSLHGNTHLSWHKRAILSIFSLGWKLFSTDGEVNREVRAHAVTAGPPGCAFRVFAFHIFGFIILILFGFISAFVQFYLAEIKWSNFFFEGCSVRGEPFRAASSKNLQLSYFTPLFNTPLNIIFTFAHKKI